MTPDNADPATPLAPDALRFDGRSPDALRPVTITRHWLDHAEGSALVEFGRTRVLCAASFTPGVPRWRKGSGEGWVTAEYAMLPRATHERTSRERTGPGGRSQEIQRLIGRSLRAAMATMEFGEYTIKVDCDVLVADGGTRCASITGGCVALVDACNWLAQRTGNPSPFGRLIAAVSVGKIVDQPMLDLCYLEDRDAAVDANVVMLEPDALVEVQGTGENGTFDRRELDRLLDLATAGIGRLHALQRAALGS